MINTGLFSSNRNDWETPKELYEELNNKYHFTLDPCSTDENAKCEYHFTIREDGLKQKWGGTEFTAIRLMEVKLESGLKKHTKKAKMHLYVC